MFSHQAVANNSGKEVITDSFKIQRNNYHYGSAFIFLPCSLETISRYPSHVFEKSVILSKDLNSVFYRRYIEFVH